MQYNDSFIYSILFFSASHRFTWVMINSKIDTKTSTQKNKITQTFEKIKKEVAIIKYKVY